MKKTLVVFFVILGCFLVSCSVQLSEDEATRIVREQKDYPDYVYYRIRGIKEDNRAVINEIQRLISDNYLTPFDSGCERFARATEKGKSYVKKVYHNCAWKKYEVEVATHKIDVIKIKEILIDKEKEEALVTYETSYEPVEYFRQFSDLYNPKQYNSVMMSRSHTNREHKVTLKKWDKGWRIK